MSTAFLDYARSQMLGHRFLTESHNKNFHPRSRSIRREQMPHNFLSYHILSCHIWSNLIICVISYHIWFTTIHCTYYMIEAWQLGRMDLWKIWAGKIGIGTHTCQVQQFLHLDVAALVWQHQDLYFSFCKWQRLQFVLLHEILKSCIK